MQPMAIPSKYLFVFAKITKQINKHTMSHSPTEQNTTYGRDHILSKRNVRKYTVGPGGQKKLENYSSTSIHSPGTTETREVRSLSWDSWRPEQFAHLANGCCQGRPSVEEVEVGQQCAHVRWEPENHQQAAGWCIWCSGKQTVGGWHIGWWGRGIT
jgi:hypothetical protein